jgi:hypothetical protein
LQTGVERYAAEECQGRAIQDLDGVADLIGPVQSAALRIKPGPNPLGMNGRFTTFPASKLPSITLTLVPPVDE